MSTFSGIRLVAGLNGTGTPSGDNLSGSLQIGLSPTSKLLTTATKIVSFEALLVGSASDLVIDVSDLDSTGTTAFTAGTAQVETATVVAASGITGNGNAAVVVTAADVTGSPVTVPVALTTTEHTTAALIAEAIRTALAANDAIAAVYTVGGTSATVTLTRIASATYTIQGVSTPVYPANDSTLNISIDNDTCTGITTAATSANTTSGVATAGVYVPGLTGNDAFGTATGGLSECHGLCIKVDADSPGGVTITQGTVMADLPLGVDDLLALSNPDLTDITIEPVSTAQITVTLAGL